MADQNKGLDTGTKIVIGLASLALLFAVMGSEPSNDAWGGGDDDVQAVGPTGTTWATSSGDGASVPGAPEGDPWSRGAPPSSSSSGTGSTVDDPWTRGSSSSGGGDDGSDVPADDPWTRGSSSSSGGDDEVSIPADDPWTRGQDSSGDDTPLSLPPDDPWTRGSSSSGGGDGGPRPCAGMMEFEVSGGMVVLPTDRPEDEFASPDCVIARGQSGDPVRLVQLALNQCNGQLVAISGTADAATAQALKNVQSRQGVGVDGVYGPATRDVMSWPTRPSGGGSVRCLTHQDIS